MITYPYASVRDVIPTTPHDFYMVTSGHAVNRFLYRIVDGLAATRVDVRGQPTVFFRDGDDVVLRAGDRFYGFVHNGELKLKSFPGNNYFNLRGGSYQVCLTPNCRRCQINYQVHSKSDVVANVNDLIRPLADNDSASKRTVTFNVTSDGQLLVMETCLYSGKATHKIERLLSGFWLDDDTDPRCAGVATVYTSTYVGKPVKPEILAGACRPLSDGRIGWAGYEAAGPNMGYRIEAAEEVGLTHVGWRIQQQKGNKIDRRGRRDELYYFDAQGDLLAWCDGNALVVQKTDNVERMRVVPKEGRVLRGCRIAPNRETVWCWTMDELYIWDLD